MSERPADPPSLPEQLDDIATDLRQWAGEDIAPAERVELREAARNVESAADSIRFVLGEL